MTNLIFFTICITSVTKVRTNNKVVQNNYTIEIKNKYRAKENLITFINLSSNNKQPDTKTLLPY